MFWTTFSTLVCILKAKYTSIGYVTSVLILAEFSNYTDENEERTESTG